MLKQKKPLVSKTGLKSTKPMRKISKKQAQLDSDNRKQCFEKYGKACFLCGKEHGIEHHHWQFKRSQKPELKNDVNNLIPLCNSCHTQAHESLQAYLNTRDEIRGKMETENIQCVFCY